MRSQQIVSLAVLLGAAPLVLGSSLRAQDKPDRHAERVAVLLGRDTTAAAEARAALLRAGPAAVPALAAVVADPAAHGRETAAEVIGAIGTAGAAAAIPTLIAALGDGDGGGDDNLWAADVLVRMQKPAIEPLRAVLDEKDLSRQRCAVYALAQLAHLLPTAEKTEIATAVAAHEKSGDERLARLASAAASRFGALDVSAAMLQPAMTALRQAKPRDYPDVRAPLVLLAPNVPGLAEVMVDALRDPELTRNHPEFLIERVASLGELARPYLPQLIELLRDGAKPPDTQQTKRTYVVGRILASWPKLSIPLLKPMLNDEDPRILGNAMFAVHALEDASRPMIGDIEKALQRKGLPNSLVVLACETLERHGTAGQAALSRAAKKGDAVVSAQAQASLKRLKR